MEHSDRGSAWILGLLAVVALAAGCSSPPTDGSTRPETEITAPPTDSALAEGTIGPEGGTIRHPSGAELVVPEGALAARTKISLTPIAAPPAQQLGAVPVGYGVEASPAGLTFMKPAELRLPFDASRIPAGGSIESVRVRMAPTGTNDFSVLSSEVDRMTNVVRASTLHFTTFVPSAEASPIFVTTTSLPAATVAVVYATTLAATGGAPPYTWSLSPGSTTAPGLSLATNGALAGSPTFAGTFSFFVTVTDAASAKTQAALSLAVAAAPIPPPSPTNPVPVVGSVSPSSLPISATPTQVTVTGSKFISTSSVAIGSAGIPTTFVSAGELRALVPASYLAAPGTLQLGVYTPAPGGGFSASTIPLTVHEGTPGTPCLRTLAGANRQFVYGIASDAAGNMIITGAAYGTIDLGGTVFTSKGARDAFVAKYDASCTLLFAKQFGDIGDDLFEMVRTDAAGNIYVGGDFQGAVDFGTGVLTSAGGYDIIVAKLDSAGTTQWAKRFGGPGVNYVKALDVDATGNLVIGGPTNDAIDLGGGAVPRDGILRGAYIAKLDTTGAHVWSHGFAPDASGQVEVNDIAFGKSGDVHVAGFAQQNLDFGGGPIAFGPSTQVASMFVLKRRGASGAHMMSKAVLGLGSVKITTDSNGDLFLSGGLRSSPVIDLGDGPLADLDAGGNLVSRSAFLAKLDGDTHALVWSHGFGKRTGPSTGQGWVSIQDFLVTTSGMVLAITQVTDTADFGGGSVSTGGYIQTFTSAGAWSSQTSQALPTGAKLARTPSGNLLLGGWTGAYPNEDGFIRRLGP